MTSFTPLIDSLPATVPFVGPEAILRRSGIPMRARIGLDAAFTIHDRGDAEDLLGLVRHEIGLSNNKNRFPMKGTCLSIYSRTVNSGEPLAQVLKTVFPWCAQWEVVKSLIFG